VDEVGWHYLRAQERVDVLLRTLDDEAWERPVRACPGWRVRDVLAHLVGTPEDAVAGRLDGLPTTEQTAEQVERHRHDDPVDLLDQWLAMGPMVAAAVTASGLWPAAIDAVTHEQDLRAALDRPGARDVPSVDHIADMLGRLVEAPVPVVFDLGDRQVESAVGSVIDEGTGPAEPLVLRTTAFELLRLRLGRRSRRQVAAMDWSASPEPVLADLFVFGPTTEDLIE
jgi:uncharacterized protein (TIGR03083 family)